MITLALLWIAWCCLHSLLLGPAVHRLAEERLGRGIAFYRLFYVALSIITLVPVAWYQLSLPQQVILEMSVPLRIAQAFLLAYALFMFLLGARAYDMRYFLGIGQARDFFRKQKIESQSLKTEGILAHVRHPWYSGGIAFLWAISPYTDVNLVSRIILTAYLVAGTLHEEHKLRRQFGNAYREYCRRVPMLIPRK